MLLQIVSVFILMFSSALCAPGGEKQDTKQVERKDQPTPDTRNTLNIFRDESFGRIVDAYRNESESPFQNFIHKLALLVGLFSQSSNNQNSTRPVRSNKTEPDTRGTLDSIGGGNFVRLVGSYRSEETIWDSFNNFIKKLAILSVIYSQHGNSHQNSTQTQPIRRNRTEPDTRGTLDSLGGGNIVKLTDSYRSEETIWDSLNNFIKKLAIMSVLITNNGNHQNSTQPESAKRNKTETDTRGTLDPIGGGNLVRLVDLYRSEQTERYMGGTRQNMMRLARDDKSQKAAIVDRLGGGRIVDPYRSEQIFRSLDRVHFLDSLDNYQGGEVLRMLDAITGGDLLSSLDSSEATVFLNALRNTHTKHPKRMLDSMSGWSFGESKRNFDEIDNVGFTGFAKKSSPRRGQYLSLAKKNFDEIDRAGFETYNKRNFDEIDRTGFETFEKRDRKD